MAELTYVALKPLRVGGQRREPGSLVPEALDWPRVSAWVDQGRIVAVARGAVDQGELEAAEKAYEARKAANRRETEVEAAEGSDEDPIEEFSTGNGWYEVPGAGKKLRRDEAIEFLESLEDEELEDEE